MISSLLIANRGEIACRIQRTATAMGIRNVAIYSDVDAHALHVRNADVAVRIGPAPAGESYLRGDLIIEAALKHGAEAIHPGYGFLAENADFAKAVVDAGLIFVGPSSAAIKAMGAKAAAKALMQAADVPIVPGFHGEGQGPEDLFAEANRIGYPVLIKASLGGGGKGMRRVDKGEEFLAALEATKREAMAAFGDDRVIIERFVASPRHIEVQIFADTFGNMVHLFERDCSLQRRHQKIIEEAPAPGMTDVLRQRMTEAAIAAAKAVNYVSAGTVEFIVEGTQPLNDETPFYFMEMNTRLQVEHPVTEAITGFDLVEWQLRVASGEALPVAQRDIGISGHSIEARLYAEAPSSGFLPSIGPILRFEVPQGLGIRVDSGIEEGGEVSPYYDPMIAKVIAQGETRPEAITRLDNALAALEFAGPHSNQAFLRQLLADETFQSGRMDTGLIEAGLERFLAGLAAPDHLISSGVTALFGRSGENGSDEQSEGSIHVSPWNSADGFQLGPTRHQTCDIMVDDTPRTVSIEWHEGVPQMEGVASNDIAVSIIPINSGVIVVGEGHQVAISVADPFQTATQNELNDGTLLSPMPGQVMGVVAIPGDTVVKGQLLMHIEAMKMEHAIVAPFAGILAKLDVASGDRVDQGDQLAVIEAPSSDDHQSEPV